MGTDSGKSAYMHIYERKRKMDVREVISAEVVEVQTEEAKAETVKLESGRDVESIVPAWIKGIVEKDNL